jgi:hypothetical protein
MPRLAVLRMHSMTRLTVKEPNEPCVFLVNLPEPLTDMQLRRLVLAAPWSPVMIEAMLGPWHPGTKTFDAEIQAIESMPRAPAPPKPKRQCTARRQNCRLVIV